MARPSLQSLEVYLATMSWQSISGTEQFVSKRIAQVPLTVAGLVESWIWVFSIGQLLHSFWIVAMEHYDIVVFHWSALSSLCYNSAAELPLTFYFGVKFYAVDPCKLHAEITRYQFFLQVKRDVEQGRLPVPIELAAQLAAYAVQCKYVGLCCLKL